MPTSATAADVVHMFRQSSGHVHHTGLRRPRAGCRPALGCAGEGWAQPQPGLAGTSWCAEAAFPRREQVPVSVSAGRVVPVHLASGIPAAQRNLPNPTFMRTGTEICRIPHPFADVDSRSVDRARLLHWQSQWHTSKLTPNNVCRSTRKRCATGSASAVVIATPPGGLSRAGNAERGRRCGGRVGCFRRSSRDSLRWREGGNGGRRMSGGVAFAGGFGP